MVGDKKNSVLIVTTIPFPNGNAPSNRIFSYAFGFEENSLKCKVLVLKPNQNKLNKNYKYKNIIDDLSYIYPGRIVFGSKYLLLRKIQYIYSSFASFAYFIFSIKNYHLIIFYGNMPFIELIFITIAKLFKIPIYKELSEHPNIIFCNFRFLSFKISKYLYYKIIFRYYDYIISMTTRISDLLLKNGIKSIIVNNTIKLKYVDYKNFNKDLFSEKYIAYIGSLDNEKDGILDLLKAISIIRNYNNEILLKVAGFGNVKDLERFHFLILELNLSSNVEYLGEISNSNVKLLMNNSLGLISVRPPSLQAEYGFPTKIIEYFSSMKPVITTVNGDLELFIVDYENALVIKDNSAEIIADKILYLINNIDKCLKIGLNGYNLLDKHFNPKTEVTKIIALTNI